jgi:adenylate cyclase
VKILENKFIKSIIFSVLVGGISFALVMALQLTPVYSLLQNTVYDAFFNTLPIEPGLTDDVAIIPIDDYSLEFYKNNSVLWPWSRDIWAMLSYYAISKGAKAVVFDIVMSEPDIDRLTGYGSDFDMKFAQVMQGSQKVVMAFNVVNVPDEIKNEPGWQPKSLETLQALNSDSLIDSIHEYDSIIPPIEAFTQVMNNFGYVDIEAESDGVIRKYKPLVKVADKVYPSLALAPYLMTAEEPAFPDSITLDKKGDFRLFWYGPGGTSGVFQYISPIDILKSFVNERNQSGPLVVDETDLAGKIVFVGATAKGLLDMKSTPFTITGEPYPGVEVHATAYLNIKNGDTIKSLNPWLELPLYLLIAVLLALIGINAKSLPRYSIIYFVLWIAINGGHYLIFRNYMIMTSVVFYILLLLISYFLTLIVNYIVVGQSRNKIRNAFGTYLSPDLVKKVTDSNQPLTTGGTELVASAIFIDIQGFTTFSEKNPPDKVVEILNLYLKSFCDVIMNNQGYVNKFLGDGLMALFGCPSVNERHADLAVKSAFECFEINQRLSKDYGLNVRIGVNSGKMIAGDIGGGKKLEYTAIGDPVNTASRLEGANNFFKTRIMIGANTYELLKESYDLRYIGKFCLKGKDIAYGMYYYTDKPDEYKERFSTMVTAYESGNRESFEKHIQYFLTIDDSFGPAEFYHNYYMKKPEKFGEPIKFTEK